MKTRTYKVLKIKDFQLMCSLKILICFQFFLKSKDNVFIIFCLTVLCSIRFFHNFHLGKFYEHKFLECEFGLDLVLPASTNSSTSAMVIFPAIAIIGLNF